MPANKGRCPAVDICDLMLRNGWVLRNVDPTKYRWKPWPEGPHDFDIVAWQPASGGPYEAYPPKKER